MKTSTFTDPAAGVPRPITPGPQMTARGTGTHDLIHLVARGRARFTSPLGAGVDEDRVTVLVPCGAWIFRPTLTVARSGALRQVTIPRWTNTGGVWH